MYGNSTETLMSFLESSPTAFHVVANIRHELKADGYEELYEGDNWDLQEGSKYFVVRNESSLISFRLPNKGFSGFQIASAHTDSPSFKIKGEKPEMEEGGIYVKLNVEGYGGMLMAPWFDRPLSVAGRVIVKEKSESGKVVKLITKLVDIDRELFMIPSVAIHMNRKANDGISYNVQKDMLPLFGDISSKGKFIKIVADSIGIKETEIISSDLFLYSRMKPSIWGAQNEYFSAPHIDDLQCTYSIMKAFVDAEENEHAVQVFVAFDNEEVGSGTKQGADSTFLRDILDRIGEGCGLSKSKMMAAVASSFMVSADNAHAVHPNSPEKCDPVNKPQMNKGIVIKYNANQKYTTDAVSAAMFKQICEKAKVPYQEFVNRSDMAGGSTLGNISNAHVSLNSIDIGLAQLAMHSPYETAGTKDTEYMIKALKCFFEASVTDEGRGGFSLNL